MFQADDRGPGFPQATWTWPIPTTTTLNFGVQANLVTSSACLANKRSTIDASVTATVILASVCHSRTRLRRSALVPKTILSGKWLGSTDCRWT